MKNPAPRGGVSTPRLNPQAVRLLYAPRGGELIPWRFKRPFPTCQIAAALDAGATQLTLDGVFKNYPELIGLLP